jgi:5-methylcytosine-specific restriction endonuclease McrA
MPLWRKKNPGLAEATAARYDHSEKRKIVEKRRNQKPKRKIWRRIFDAVRNAKRRIGFIRNAPAIWEIYAQAEQWRQWGFDVVVDHVKPLAKGGLHNAGNLQILYRTENREKSVTFPWKARVVFI